MASARGRVASPELSGGAVLPFSWLEEASSGRLPNSSSGSTRRAESPQPGRAGGGGGAVSALALRALNAGAYLALCAAALVSTRWALVGASRQRDRRSLLSCFLLNLTATGLQFVLTLPFWATDTVHDFCWPFGGAMCKVVLTLTVLNINASISFLIATSAAAIAP
ncbi:hypothetical protein P7K49_013067 [Saguinus oedipus]|uniref:G-protein coupled receptors family 1 profile domain-containing protein n=1 Tax=Saguinus oedipus TaxID=9490 RepID=A0ABQ9VHR4_SAGOE|nr:hypothetical protein P7K49_013067 [Saguinus oedipus]